MIMNDVAKHVESGEPLLLFLDRFGDIDGVTLDPAEIEQQELDVQGVCMRLLESARYGNRPFFEICTVINGVIQNPGGDAISIDDLPTALKAAEEERVRFYSEREKEYGTSAWPMSR